MKNLFIIALLGLVGCIQSSSPKVTYPIYKYGSESFVPDSLKMLQAEWVKETIRAADQHLHAGDYEDPEDVIEEIQETSEQLFSREIEGLYVTTQPESWPDFIPYNRLNTKQKEVFNKLKE